MGGPPSLPFLRAAAALRGLVASPAHAGHTRVLGPGSAEADCRCISTWHQMHSPHWLRIDKRCWRQRWKKPSDEFLTVRARDPEDLNRLRERLPELGPTKLEGGDYCCRARVPRAAFAAGLATIASEIDYDNFKNAVQKSMGSQRARIYHEVWTAAYQIQKGVRPHHF